MLPLKIIIFYLQLNYFKIPIAFPRTEYWYLSLLERHASPWECLQMLPKLAILIMKLTESKLIILNHSYKEQHQFWSSSTIFFSHRVTALTSISNVKIPINNQPAIKGLQKREHTKNVINLDHGGGYEKVYVYTYTQTYTHIYANFIYVCVNFIMGQLRFMWISIYML